MREAGHRADRLAVRPGDRLAVRPGDRLAVLPGDRLAVRPGDPNTRARPVARREAEKRYGGWLCSGDRRHCGTVTAGRTTGRRERLHQRSDDAHG